MHPDEKIREEALHWAVRTGDHEFTDWDGFALWLERSPAHARAYDEAMVPVDDALDTLAHPPAYESALNAANDDTPATTSRWNPRWFGPALAASLAAVAVVGLWQAPAGDDLYVTPRGETLQIALDDGSTIQLAGGSRLIVEDGGARRARLEEGRALFNIRHDESDPFLLVAGNDTLVDAGTIFDVRLGRERLEVGVAEGAVIVNPQTRDLRLDAGERLTLVAGRYTVEPVPLAEVGEWTEGRVTFREAPLGEIAVELSRATGTAFIVAPASEDVELSGSIALGPISQDPRTLELLLGVRVSRNGDSWMLSAD